MANKELTPYTPEYRQAFSITLEKCGTAEAQAGTRDPLQAAANLRGIAKAYRLGIIWSDHMPALHFIGFKDDRYWAAVKVFGKPDFYHRVWDVRARQEVVPGDVAVFASGTIDDPPKPFSWDDSQQDILARGGKEYFL